MATAIIIYERNIVTLKRLYWFSCSTAFVFSFQNLIFSFSQDKTQQISKLNHTNANFLLGYEYSVKGGYESFLFVQFSHMLLR